MDVVNELDLSAIYQSYDGASKSFERAYNCQAAVDEKSQIIVAANVTQQTNDKQQVKPLVEEIKQNTGGDKPKKVSGDTGYFGGTNIEYLEEQQIDGYIATARQKHWVGILLRICCAPP